MRPPADYENILEEAFLLARCALKGERSKMTEKMFSRYLQLSRYQAVTQQLYRQRLISRSDLLTIKKHIDSLEMEMIIPKQKHARHPRKITVTK